MKQEERLHRYVSTLKQIEGREGAFAIFTHEPSGKFVQLASLHKKGGFIIDIPVIKENPQLSKKEISKIPGDFEKRSEKGCMAYNKRFDSLDDAVKFIEYFFREICSLPENCPIKVESHKGETKCDLYGKTVKEKNIKIVETPLNEARKIGIPKNRIEKLIEDHICFAKEKSNLSDDELEDEIKIIKERGAIFPALCLKCKKKLK